MRDKAVQKTEVSQRSVRHTRVIPLTTMWPLGFAFQILWNSLIVRQNTLDHANVDIHLVFYVCFGIFALLIALLFSLRTLKTSSAPIRALCLMSALCMLISSAALTLTYLEGSLAAAWIGPSVGAAGSLASMLAWGYHFRRVPLAESMSSILAAFMLDFLLMSFSHLLFPAAATIVLALFALGGPLCLLMSERHFVRTAEKQNKADAPDSKETPDATKASVPANTPAKELARSGADDWLDDTSSGRLFDYHKDGALARTVQKRRYFVGLLAAFALYALVLTLRTPVSFQSSGLAIAVFNILAFVICTFLFWVLIIKRSPVSFERMMQSLYATFAFGFFLQPFLPQAVSGIPPALFFVATSAIYMVVWMAVVEIASESEHHTFVIVGIWGACYGCPRLLYFALSAVTPVRSSLGNEAILATAVVALFCLFIALFLLSRHPLKAYTFFTELSKSEEESSPASLPSEKYQELAKQHQLTARESEVFCLMCNGHSRRYIADLLYISENTVKAHLKRIYVKTGIHSKYDLEKVLEQAQGDSEDQSPL